MQRLRVHDATTAPRILLLAGVFLSPTFFDLGAVKPFDVPKVALLWVLGWLAFGLTIAEVLRGDLRPVRLRLTKIAGLLLLATGVSTLFSYTRTVSVFGWYGRYNGFLETLLYVVIFWLITQLYWRRPDRLTEVIVAIAAASAVNTAYILVQWVGLDPIKWIAPSGSPAFRFFGTMGNADFAGGYLGATFGWLVFAFRRAGRLRFRLLVVAWAIATLFAIWQTSSRDGLVAVVVSLGVAVIVSRGRLPRLMTVSAAAITAVVIVGGLAFALSRHPKGPAQPGANLGVLRTNTLFLRSYWWRGAVAVFASRPVVGAGPDTFVVAYPRHAVPAAANVFGSEQTDDPHNILLQRLSSLGILGLLSYLALIFAAFRWGLAKARRLTGRQRDLLACFVVVLAGYIGQGVFSIDISALAVVGWVALGGIAALADPSLPGDAGTGRAESRSGAGSSRLVAAVAVIVIAAVAAAGVRPWLADRATKQALRDAAHTASTDIVLRSYDRAVSLAPYDPVYRTLAARFLTDQAHSVDDPDIEASLLGQAIDFEKQADALQPGNPFWKAAIGAATAVLAETNKDVSLFDESAAWLADAERLAPNDYRVVLQHGVMLNRWGRATHDGLKYCEAIRVLNRSNRLHPDVDAYAGLAQAYAATGRVDEALVAARRALSFNGTNSSISTLVGRVEQLQHQKVKFISCP